MCILISPDPRPKMPWEHLAKSGASWTLSILCWTSLTLQLWKREVPKTVSSWSSTPCFRRGTSGGAGCARLKQGVCLWSPGEWWSADAVSTRSKETVQKISKCTSALFLHLCTVKFFGRSPCSAQSLAIWKWFELFEMRLLDSNLWTSMNTSQ